MEGKMKKENEMRENGRAEGKDEERVRERFM